MLGAFGMIGGAVALWAVILLAGGFSRIGDVVAVARVTRPMVLAVQAGTALTVVFGVWLAIYQDGYELWDGWILAGLVLWAISVASGMRAGAVYAAAQDRARELAAAGVADAGDELDRLVREGRGLLWHAVSSLALLLVLVDMIWKPGQ